MNSDNIVFLRATAHKASLIDAVETALARHVDDNELCRLLEAVSDDESISGKWRQDNLLAALRLQELSRSVPIIASEKLTVVQRAMNAVLRRWGLAVDQRRASVAGGAA